MTDTVDLAKVIRLLSAAREAGASPGERERYYSNVYFDLRGQVLTAIPDDLAGEFNAAFPGPESTSAGGRQRLAALAGWLDGILQFATLDRRIKAEAEARAELEAKKERGFGFTPPEA